MITIIGTGHVFRLSEPIMFLIKNIWPDAVLVELDYARFKALTESSDSPTDNDDDVKMPWAYRHAAKYQKKLAEENRSDVGSELVTAALMGRQIGAEVGFIDTDAVETMNQMWKEMPFGEKFRYTVSSFTDRIRGSRHADAVITDFSENEEKVVADLRRKYPTLVRKLLDERNVLMADRIRTYAERYESIVVVCGDSHVEGVSSLLSDHTVRKIRLRDIMDKQRFDRIRSEAWNHKGEIE